MACPIGRCEIYKAGMKNNTKRYGDGVKRCGECNKFIKWEGGFVLLGVSRKKFIPAHRCPCCERRLRGKPKNKNKT